VTESVFLDTNGWIALLNTSDDLHRPARAVWDRLARERTPIVLTDWVAAETGNGLARFPVRENFGRAVDLLESSPRATLLSIDQALFHQALRLYGERSDKSWGLVDCASFVVMEARGIRAAFTDDRHFEQAGFRRLLSSD
jgi:uncharacterized protein